MNREELGDIFLAASNREGTVTIPDSEISDADFAAVLRALPPLPGLENILLANTRIGNLGLAALVEVAMQRGFPKLKWIWLSSTEVGDVGVKALAAAAIRHSFSLEPMFAFMLVYLAMCIVIRVGTIKYEFQLARATHHLHDDWKER